MITYAQLTQTGGRALNEDSVGVWYADDSIFCVLADGLGGHNAGEVASALAVDSAKTLYAKSHDLPFDEVLGACMLAGQAAIEAEQHKRGRINELKTTAVMLLIEKTLMQWAYVGDSRIYRFDQAGMVAERSLDHSVPQMLVLQGEIDEADIRGHEDRNRLTRVMGAEWDTPKFTLSAQMELTEPATFLLCSDGFWELIDEERMSELLLRCAQPQTWLNEMEKIVLQNGMNTKMDNYSAIAVYVR